MKKFKNLAFIAAAILVLGTISCSSGDSGSDSPSYSGSNTSESKSVSLDSIKAVYDTSISTSKSEILETINKIKTSANGKTYSSDTLKPLIPELIKSWAKKPNTGTISSLLSEKDCDALKNNIYGLIHTNITSITIDEKHTLVVSFSSTNSDDSLEENIENLIASYISENASSDVKTCISKITVSSSEESEMYSPSFKTSFTNEIAELNSKIVEKTNENLKTQLYNLVLAEVKNTLSEDLLIKLIPETVKTWKQTADVSKISVLLNKENLKALESSLTAALKAEIAKGLTFKTDASLSSGFKVSVEDVATVYDYSYKSITNLITEYFFEDFV